VTSATVVSMLAHKKNESKYWNKSGIDTPSFWRKFLLWHLPTITASYQDIQKINM
jgi:hypothetical protein